MRDDRSTVTLDIAALELAAIEFPGLDQDAFLFRLDHLAEQIGSQLTPRASGQDFIKGANELLFDVMQFRGNSEQYYDPRNSCLNSVLMRRLGIPISLSLVYMEVARRLGRNVYGVGLPGHFIVAYEDSESRYWLDPFRNGRILSFAELCNLAKEASNVDLRLNPALLGAVTKRQILVRMLSNLKAIYLRGEAFDKARQVLDLLIDAMPEYAVTLYYRLRPGNFFRATHDNDSFIESKSVLFEGRAAGREILRQTSAVRPAILLLVVFFPAYFPGHSRRA